MPKEKDEATEQAIANAVEIRKTLISPGWTKLLVRFNEGVEAARKALDNATVENLLVLQARVKAKKEVIDLFLDIQNEIEELTSED